MQPSGHPPVIPLQCILVFLGEGGRSQSYAWGHQDPRDSVGGEGPGLPAGGLGGAQNAAYLPPPVLRSPELRGAENPCGAATQECQDPSLLSSGKNAQPRSWEMCVIQQTKPRT